MHVPAYAWVLSAFVGIAFSWWAYRFLWPKHFIWKIAAILRAVALALVLFWLFNPLINYEKNETIPAQWDVYIDASNSIKLKPSAIRSYLDSLEKAFPKVRFREFAFGESVLSVENKQQLNSKLTRFDAVFDHMDANKSQTGLRFILSDGIVNQGRMSESYNWEGIGPVCTIGMGDSAAYTDIAIDELLVNDEVYQGNSTDLEAVISASKVKGESINIEIWIDKRMAHGETWIPESEFSKKRLRYTLQTSNAKGDILNIEVRAKSLKGEKIMANNAQARIIKILDKRKIVDVVFGAVHPDMKAIQMALTGKEAYTLRAYSENEGIKKDADAYILHGVKRKETFTQIKGTKKPLWWFAYNRESIEWLFNQEGTSAIRKGLTGFQESTPARNLSFENFQIKDVNANSTIWNAVETPLFTAKVPNDQVQYYQEWNGVVTNVPLMFSRKSNRSEHVFLGLGIWKWRMNEFRKTQSSDEFDNWVLRNIQWLIRSSTGKAGWDFMGLESPISVGERRKIKWNFYDEAGELQSSKRVEAYIENESKETENLNVLIENNAYTAFFTPSSVGLNKIILKGSDGEIYKESFARVNESNIEDLQTRAQFGAMAKIAKKSGGIFNEIHQKTSPFISQIKELRLDKSKIVVAEQNLPFERLPLVLLVIASMLGIEWFIRKWMGKV